LISASFQGAGLLLWSRRLSLGRIPHEQVSADGAGAPALFVPAPERDGVSGAPA